MKIVVIGAGAWGTALAVNAARTCSTSNRAAPRHQVTLWARDAALVNGCAAHALDFDDVNLNISGHPSAVIAPALLALADVRESSGAELLMAFLAGYEFACRVGVLVEPGHYTRGYHATSTVGALGAALGCARLMGLTESEALHAVGIAAPARAA